MILFFLNRHFNLTVICKERDLILLATFCLYNIIFLNVCFIRKWRDLVMAGILVAKLCAK